MTERAIFLIRHAASSGQAPDAELSADGKLQAENLATWLEGQGIDALYSSPYRRAVATLEPFSGQSGLPISILSDLRERRLAPTPLPDYKIHLARSFDDRSYKLEGGESLNETCQRAIAELRVVYGANVQLAAVAAHGTLISSIFNFVDPNFGFEDWQALQNPDVFRVTLEDHGPTGFERLEL